jgi:transposase
MKAPKQIDLSEEEYKKLQERIKQRELQESDYELLAGTLQFMIWLQRSLKEAKISIGRLTKLFGFSSKGKKKRRTSPKNYTPPSSSDESESEPGSEVPQPSEDKKRKGHGRIPHTAYTGAPTVEVPLNDLQAGDDCPLECGGILKNVPAGYVIRVTGSPIAAATRYQLEKLRCVLCGEYFTAELPSGVNRDEKYDARAKAAVTLQKYYMGTPFNRQATFQQLLGMPLPAGTAWQLCEELGDAAYPIYGELMVQGAQGEVLHNDDANVKILSMMKENQQDPKVKRKSMYTSGILSKIRLPDGSEIKVAIFISGRNHAGNNLDLVLQNRREELGLPIQMSDALSSSKTKEHTTISCSCLAHGFRKFEDIMEYWPDKCHFVMKRISEVYEFEEQTEALELSPNQRLEFHKTHSKPKMDELKNWLDEQKTSAVFDPGGSLGKAIQYMLNHWEKLTRFLKVPSAPLDNNELERSLKISVRNRKNAYFYKNEHGALIGDIHMSLIYTCWLNGVNPMDYLVEIQYYRSQIVKNPHLFLPWNYRDTIKLLERECA